MKGRKKRKERRRVNFQASESRWKGEKRNEPEVLGLKPPMVRSSGPPEVLLEVLE